MLPERAAARKVGRLPTWLQRAPKIGFHHGKHRLSCHDHEEVRQLLTRIENAAPGRRKDLFEQLVGEIVHVKSQKPRSRGR